MIVRALGIGCFFSMVILLLFNRARCTTTLTSASVLHLVDRRNEISPPQSTTRHRDQVTLRPQRLIIDVGGEEIFGLVHGVNGGWVDPSHGGSTSLAATIIGYSPHPRPELLSRLRQEVAFHTSRPPTNAL